MRKKNMRKRQILEEEIYIVFLRVEKKLKETEKWSKWIGNRNI